MEPEQDLSGHHPAREVVGVFDRLKDLDEAVFDLETHGFDRAAFAVLGTEATVQSRLGRRYQHVSELADDPRAPRETFFGHVSRLEATYGPAVGLAAIGALLLSGGGALPVVVAAAGGATIGAAIGALIHHREAERMGEQLARGGLLFWVNVRTGDQERTATEVLSLHQAHDVHAHDLRPV